MPRLGSRQALLAGVVFAAVVAAVVVVLSFAVPGPGALLLAVLPPTALFVALYSVVRWAVAAGLRDEDRGGTRTAREILDARYAAGEIGPEDYERRRSHLETP